MSRLIWRRIGAANPARWVEDTGGRAIAATGFACTLRDLARLRDEEQPDGELHDVDSGFVGRLRHAFKR